MATERNSNQVPSLQVKSNAADDADVILWGDPSTHRLLTSSTISAVTGASSIGDGTATLTTAGTAVQLSSQACSKVFIQAHESNTGTIVVGGSTVVAALAGRRGKTLFATQGDWFYVSNMNLLYIDSTVSGDKITFYYES